MSIDSKLVATDGERGRYTEKITVDSGAGESVVNPDDWPNIDLKPSEGSEKGQRNVGPGGEKIDKLGELTVKVRTERHGGGGHLKPNDIPGSQGSQAFASTEVDPSYCQTRVPVSHPREKPSQGFKDAYRCMRKMEPSSCERGNLRTNR